MGEAGEVEGVAGEAEGANDGGVGGSDPVGDWSDRVGLVEGGEGRGRGENEEENADADGEGRVVVIGGHWMVDRWARAYKTWRCFYFYLAEVSGEGWCMDAAAFF